MFIWRIDSMNKMSVKQILYNNQRSIIMPLVKGKSAKTKKGFGENVKREMEAGKPQKQAVAIAYSEARKSKKHGGKKK